ncbi:MAG: tetratricopeptide repeat protein [Candidatus Omnitrophota bacterium]
MIYIIFALAFIIRLIYIIQLKSTIFYNHFLLDEALYNNWARSIAGGEWLKEGVFDAMPLYPYLLGIIYKLTNYNLFISRLIQCVIGSFSCVLVYWITDKLFKNKLAARIAALIACFYVPFVFYCGLLLPAVYVLFFYLLVLWYVLKVIDEPRIVRFLCLGLFTGLAALTKAGILLFLPAMLLWIIYTASEKRRAVIGAMISILAALCIILPITLKNYLASGDLIFMSSHAGLNFYIGNNENADGTFKAPSWARSNIEGLNEDAKTIAERELSRELSEREVSDFYFKKGMRFIKEKPLMFLRLLGRKLILYINKYEIFDNADLYIYRNKIPIFRIMLMLPFLTFLFVGSLGLAGMVVAVPRFKQIAPFYIFVITYTVSIMLYFVNARYRLPFVMAMAVFSGYFIAWFIDKIRQKNYKLIAFSFGLLMVSVFIVNIPAKIDVFSNGYVNLGNLYMEAGDLEKAKGAFYAAIKGADKVDPKTYNDLGYLFIQQNKLKDAERYLQEALSEQPDYPFAHINLGLLYEKKNMQVEAEREYKEAIRLNPNIPQAHNNLANIYENTQRRSMAIDEYRRAIELDPTNAKTHYNLGVICGRAGRLAESKNEFERAAQADPEFIPAQDALKYFE